ncbi:hypothetical protein DIPPA_02410 [Diplonema papillatum]|nr:hypothetical protein DIPPA_02410 [Diplonema papillatum]
MFIGPPVSNKTFSLSLKTSTNNNVPHGCDELRTAPDKPDSHRCSVCRHSGSALMMPCVSVALRTETRRRRDQCGVEHIRIPSTFLQSPPTPYPRARSLSVETAPTSAAYPVRRTGGKRELDRAALAIGGTALFCVVWLFQEEAGGQVKRDAVQSDMMRHDGRPRGVSFSRWDDVCAANGGGREAEPRSIK